MEKPDPRFNVIAIDGPAGAGKSTLALGLARALNWARLDTGAIYRALALNLAQKGLFEPTPEEAGDLALRLRLEFIREGSDLKLLVNGQDPGEALREPAISRLASVISAMPKVRSAFLPKQRAEGEKGQIVAEGRDMGTAIFPEAKLKFFLKADPKARAARRLAELLGQGAKTDFDEVLADVIARDRRDETRSLDPLFPAKDAIEIDSTDSDAAAVLAFCREKAREVFGV
jgi:cytidylate kinase